MDAITCPKCGSANKVKAGFVRTQQRYACKDCESRYLYLPNGEMLKTARQQQAVELYLEGLGIRSISRIIHISHATVIQWLKQMAIKLQPIAPLYANHIEIDELYFYLKTKKRKRWLWLAICRESKRILGFQIGGRGKVTLQKLMYKIEPIQCERFYTDEHGPFKAVLSKEKHRCYPGVTNTIEGINSAIRHYLARFRRRGKCYTKSLAMMEVSIRLFMYKLDKNYAESPSSIQAA